MRSLACVALVLLLAPASARAQAPDDAELAFRAARRAETGRGGQRDYPRARRIYGRLCHRDVAAACNNLGVMYEEGRGVPPDAERAVRLFKHACRAGHGLGCANAGRIFRSGAPGVRADAAIARRLLRAACAQRQPLGCLHLGQMLEAAGAFEAARARYQIGCEENGTLSCHSLAMLYARGQGVPQDRVAARELLDEQCRSGHQPSCRESSDLGCEDGDAEACLRRGRRLYAAAREAGVSTDRAVEPLSLACEGGSAEGCHALGVLRLREGGDRDAALGLFVAACEGGHARGCLAAARLTEGPDRHALLSRACNGGEPEACAAVGGDASTRHEAPEPAPETRPTSVDAIAPPPRPERSPRGTMRRHDVAPMLRVGLGGVAWVDGGQSVGGAFHLETDVGLRLLLDSRSGFTLNPSIGGILSAGDQTALAAQVGADLGFELDWAFLSYGARLTGGTLADHAFIGVRHGLFFELAGFLGLHVAHDVVYGEAQPAPLHGVSVSLTIDPGVFLYWY